MARSNHTRGKNMTVFINISLVSSIFTGLVAMSMMSDVSQSAVTPPAKIARPLYSFSGKLFTTLMADPATKSENIVVSPLNIHVALNLGLLGTDANSTTKRELMSAMGYADLTDAEMTQCHGEYSQLLAEFREATRKADEEKAKRESSKDKDDTYNDSSDRLPTLDAFNLLITKNKGELNATYKATVEKYYSGQVTQIDDNKPETKTRVLDKLNSWAKQAGFESPVLDSKALDEKFAAIILSAIRVEAFWFEDFYESKGAEKSIFYNRGLQSAPVDGITLSQGDIDGGNYLELTSESKAKFKNLHKRVSESASSVFKDLCEFNFQMVEVPLQGDLSFIIIEPLEFSKDENDDKLTNLIREKLYTRRENGMTYMGEAVGLLDSELGHNKIDSLVMPKFKIEKTVDLKRALQSMGVSRAFDRENAEISSLVTDKVYLDDIKHQAMIEVTKSGIRAAAVTRIKFALLAAFQPPQEPIKVSITKPFMFILRHKKLPLFVGRLVSL